MAKMKRMIALVLALVLCLSQLAMTTSAVDGASEQPVYEMNIAPAAPAADPAQPTGNEPVTNQTTTTSTGADGSTTTVIEKETVDKDKGTTTNEKTTITEKDTNIGNGNLNEIATDTEIKEVVEPTTTTNPDGSTEEKKSSTETDIDRDESTEIKNHDLGNGEQLTTVENKGEETKITDKEDVTTTETQDTIIETQADYHEPATDETVDGSTSETTDKTLNDDWNEGSLGETTPWVTEAVVEGTETTPVELETTAATELSVDLYEQKEDVTIQLKPDGQWYSSDRVAQITVEDLKAGKYPDIFDPSKYPNNGADVNFEVLDDGNGNVIGWTITYKTETVTGGQGTTDKSGSSDNAGTVTPGAPTPKEVQEYEDLLAEQDANGVKEEILSPTQKQITRYERVIDADGNFLGYRKIVELVTVEAPVTTKTDIKEGDQLHTDNYDQQTTTRKWLELPTNVPTNETNRDNGDGTFSDVTVSPITDTTGSDYTNIGDTVGYSITTEIKDASGKVIRTETREIYGTAFTETIVTTWNPETLETIKTNTKTQRDVSEVYANEYTRDVDVNLWKVDEFETTVLTEKDTYQMIETGTGTYFIYQGKMYAVTGTASTSNDYSVAGGATLVKENGKWVVKGGNVDLSGEDLRIYGDKYWNEWPEDWVTITDNYTGQIDWTGSYDSSKKGDWVKIGSGLYGGYLTADNKGNPHTPQQYMIYNGSEVRFVYCVELNTPAPDGAYYTDHKYTDQNETATPWDGADGNISQIRAIAVNGFWGTKEGLGSLQAVKDLLTRNGYSDVAGRLTEGIAMAGTQLAIWEYGSNGVSFGSASDTQGKYVTWADDKDKDTWVDPQDQKDIAILRKLLLELSKSSQGKSEKIEAGKIESGSITVKDQIKDSDGNVKTDGNGNQALNTDLTFTMKVTTSSLNGDLVLTFTDANGKNHKYRLAGNDDKDVTDLIYKRIHPDANGTYTLTDIPLFENTPITLNLNGVQHLDDGVYIYKNSGTQDFVGLSQEMNTVDLSWKMELRVIDPELVHTSEDSAYTRTDSQKSTSTAKRTDDITLTTTRTHKEEKNQNFVEQNIRGTITKVETLDQITMEKLRWRSYYEYLIERVDDEFGGGGNGGGNNELDIPDEEVPLAVAPATGDISLIWVLISLVSMGGAVYLTMNMKRKEI